MGLLASGALYLPDITTLLVADAHFGKAVSFRLRGVPVPQGTTTETLQRLTDALNQTQATRLIFLGDSFHDAQGEERLDMNHLQNLQALTQMRAELAGLLADTRAQDDAGLPADTGLPE